MFFFLFAFLLSETLYAFHNLVVKRKRAAMTPSETVSVLQLFTIATLPIMNLTPAFGKSNRYHVSTAGQISSSTRASLSLSGWLALKAKSKTMQTECIRSNGS